MAHPTQADTSRQAQTRRLEFDHFEPAHSLLSHYTVIFDIISCKERPPQARIFDVNEFSRLSLYLFRSRPAGLIGITSDCTFPRQ